jgi:hypothetical protein
MLISISRFHTSVTHMQKPNHPLYQRIDWLKVEAGAYACVDPMDSHAVLYLFEKEYKVQVRVCMSQDTTLVVLARPGDVREEPSSPVPNKSSDSGSTQTPPTLSQVKRGKSRFWKRFLNFHLGNLGALTKSKAGSKSVRGTGSREDDTCVTLSPAVLETLMPYWGLDLNYRLGGSTRPPTHLVKDLREFARTLRRLLDNSGPNFLIQTLKGSLFYLNKYLAGTRAEDRFLLGTPVGLSRNGIPSILPVGLRRLVAGRHMPTIRMVTALLNSFRAFEGTHDPQDLGSIVGPHPILDENLRKEFQTFCKEVFWPKVIKGHLPEKIWKRVSQPEMEFRIKDESKVYIPLNAGPNGPVGVLAAPVDAHAWARVSSDRNHFKKWCQHIGDQRSILLWESCLASYTSSHLYQHGLRKDDDVMPTRLGKLGIIPEPAGKVRIVAIVDYWTQRVMSPVHDWMMLILKHLPTDGTFNQEGALRSFVSRMGLYPELKIYSIDLKSATDMIPISLYRDVFAAIWQAPTVDLWIDLLTDRWFHVPSDKLVIKGLRGCSVKYGRGQPMGTLSSWPSMALVHHAVTLFAAMRAGYDPAVFYNYRVLGDDNVTAGADVANSYVDTAKALCIPTSTAKTLSGDAFIFAQQIYLRDNESGSFSNISPLSLKEELGVKTFAQRLEIALRAMRRGWLDSRPNLYRFLRLLLNRGDYIKSMREWSSGYLGKVAQAALISAFGVAASSIMEKLVPLTSGIRPFLLVMTNKIQALAGDQGLPGLSKKDGDRILRDLSRTLAVRLAATIRDKVKRELATARVVMIRFSTWNDSIMETGYLPLATKVRKGPVEPGLPLVPFKRDGGSQPIIEKLEKGLIPGYLPINDKFPVGIEVVGAHYPYNQYFSAEHSPEIPAYNRALWLIIKDSFQPILGYIPESESDLSYSDYEAEEDDGCGVTFTEDAGSVSTTTGRTVKVPTIVEELAKAHSSVDRIMEDLIRGEEENFLPWHSLEELARVAQGVSRLPDFTGIKCFKDAAVPPDEVTTFMRKVKLLLPVMHYLPLGTDFTVPSWDEAVGHQGPRTHDDAISELQEMVSVVTDKTKQGLSTG